VSQLMPLPLTILLQ